MISYPRVFRAAILRQNNAPLSVEEVTFEGPLLPGQVLVRILYSGICGKQLEEVRGSRGVDPFLPHLLGHEGSGKVVDCGPGVKKVKPGDHVVLHWLKASGIEAETPLYHQNHARINAGCITTFNEYGIISENRLTRIPASADLRTACLLGCAVTTGLGVVWNEAKVRPGESIAVVGCGGVGLNVIQAAALIQAHPIIAIDNNPDSLVLARRFGATVTVNSRSEDVPGTVRKLTRNLGAGHVMVTVGSAKVIEWATAAASIPGCVYLVGVPDVGATASVDAFAIHCRRSLVGSYGGGTNPDYDIERYLDLKDRGLLQLQELITKEISLDQINEGIEALKAGAPGRCVINLNSP